MQLLCFENFKETATGIYATLLVKIKTPLNQVLHRI